MWLVTGSGQHSCRGCREDLDNSASRFRATLYPATVLSCPVRLLPWTAAPVDQGAFRQMRGKDWRSDG